MNPAKDAGGATGMMAVPPVSLLFEDVRFTVKVPDVEAKPRTCGARMAGLCKRTKKVEKELIKGVSGYALPGECVAVMGASGAGKSTLIDILAGRAKTGMGSGTVQLGCDPSVFDPQAHVSYVMQDDALISTLTVRETLTYAARLKLAPRFYAEQGENIVENILRVLNLRKVANSRIGSEKRRGVSGGERRRVSIGTQLVTQPSLLFLDEPTSGLDATNALRVARALLRLAREGRTIMCTIHQPRSNVFYYFDRLLLLYEGQTVFFGPTAMATPYMATHGLVCPPLVNPADYLLDILDPEFDPASVGHEDDDDEDDGDSDERNASASSAPLNNRRDIEAGEKEKQEEDDEDDYDDKTMSPRSTIGSPPIMSPGNIQGDDAGIHPQTLVSLYPQSEYAAASTQLMIDLRRKHGATRELSRSIGTTTDRYATSFWLQFSLLWQRTLLATVRDPGVMYVRTGAALFIGLLVGLLFFQLPDEPSSSGDRTSVILFLVCVFSLFCLPALSGFIEDRQLLHREQGGGFYRTSAYFLGSFLVELPILVIVVVLYSVVCYWLVGFEPDAEHFFRFLLIVCLIINTNFATAQAIAAYVETITMAAACYMIVLVYCLLLGGFIVAKANLPEGVQWALYTSYYFYGYESLCINEFENKSYGPEFLKAMGFEADNMTIDIIALLLIFIALRVLAYLLLRFANRAH